MKLLPSRSPSYSGIEPLEARIAPAVIRIGASGLFEDVTDTEYREVIVPGDPNRGPRPAPFDELNFVDTSDPAAVSDPIAQAVESALSDNTFLLKLQAGDRVDSLTEASNYKPFITVTTGQAIAYFTDANGNNDYDNGELTGLSLSADAVVTVNGIVNGDVVTNLNNKGTKDRGDDTLDMAGLVSAKQGIKSLKVLGGSVFGDVLSGGPIQSLTIEGNVNNVLAGAAAAGVGFDFFTSAGGESLPGGVVFVPAAKQAGASISNVIVGSVTGKIAGGGGGAGAAGGSLDRIEVTRDSDGFELVAGAGGNGNAAAKQLNGGKGGNVMHAFLGGTEDMTPNSGNGIVVRAGDGGDGEPTGKGGAGGEASDINVGYFLFGNKSTPSTVLVADNVKISGGDGGVGKNGGAGGAAKTINVRILTPDVQGNEIEVEGGDGGNSITPKGKAGAGGEVRDADLRNQISTPDGDIFVHGGNAGGGGVTSKGAEGGSVTNTTLLGFDLQVVAGDGSDGTIGGLGGSVTTLTAVKDERIVPRNVLVNAGRGGIGFEKDGGGGGDLRALTVEDGDFQSFLLNAGTAGDGGNGFGGKGGKGGGLFAVSVTDYDSIVGTGTALQGAVTVRSGRGGDGSKAGGAGGMMDTVVFTGNNLDMTATGGSGGNALTKGKGGDAGVLIEVQLQTEGTIFGLLWDGTITGGNGGAGISTGGSGGAGADVRTSSLSVSGDARIVAGNGGNGQAPAGAFKGGAAGRGGSVLATGLSATGGFGEILAGDAGTVGGKAAAGGSIIGNASATGNQIVLRALTSITVTAGDGALGGPGGDIVGLGYGSTFLGLNPTPVGDILFRAGDGSAFGKTAGRGGNIDMVNGSVSSGAGRLTTFLAGDGGGGPTVTKAAGGGSITDITIARGGAPGVVLTFEAGDAGDAPLATKGAPGGNVKTIGVTDITPETIFRSVAAGDGGDALKTGGLGGSIHEVDVQDHDIGLRTGATFGYTTMGGLFAGVAGAPNLAGTKKPVPNGDVTNVTAESISAIVAGRTGVPHLAENVNNIFVAGDASTLLLFSNGSLVPDGAFKLKFGVSETPFLASSSSAAKVQQALNLLDSIAAAGGVTVASTSNGGYAVRFNLPGNQGLITGIEQVLGEILETTKGSTGILAPTETVPGEIVLPVTEVRSGQTTLSIGETTPGAGLFSTSEQTAGDDVSIAEVQILDLTALQAFPTGQYQLSFNGATTPFLSLLGSPAANAALIDTELGNLATIALVGNVTVTVAPNETARFVISFNAIGAQPQITGLRLVPETQRLDLGQIPAFPNATFDLTFNGETTAVPLPFNANAAQIEAALDALGTVGAAGGVTVASAGGTLYDITFGVNGDQPAITGGGTLPELQRINLGALSTLAGGVFTISLGNDETTPLPSNATAIQIAAALNLLPSIQAAGGVSVALGGAGLLDITYLQPGDQTSVTAAGFQKEQQTIDLNAINAIPSSEFTLAVRHELDVTESIKGTVANLAVTETVPGLFDIAIAPPVPPPTDPYYETITPGTTTVNEVQRIHVAPVLVNNGSFTLNFAGQSTGQIGTGGLFPNVANIQAALNALVAVTSVGGVTVTAGAFGDFNIRFNALGDLPQITGKATVPETQQVDLGVLAGDPAGEFTLVFQGQSTVVLPGDALAADVEAALDALIPIVALGGVTVTSPGAGGPFDIAFAVKGDQPAIVALGGDPLSHEHQVLELASLTAYSSGFFQLVFNNERTVSLPSSATDIEIENALNALNTIQNVRPGGTGAVTVTDLGAGSFDLEFNIFGDQLPVTASGAVTIDRYPIHVTETTNGASQTVVVSETRTGGAFGAEVAELTPGTVVIQEVQRVDLAPLTGATTGDFTLGFGSLSTPPLPVGSTAAQVQAALNSLATIQPGAGGVTVAAGPGNSFDITFNQPGDRPSIAALIRLAEVQTVDLGTLAAVPGGEFVLGFGVYKAAPLSVAATPAQVEAALNALPSVANAGGVTVAAAGAGKFSVSFQQLGNVSAITGEGGGTAGHEVQQLRIGDLLGVAGGTFKLTFNGQTTAPLAATATAAEIATALNLLEAVKDTRSDRSGMVAVAPGAPGIFNVTFNAFGDQPVLTGKSLTTTDRVFGSTELRPGTANLALPVAEITPGTALVPEVQTINLSTLPVLGEFQLQFDQNLADPFPPASTNLLVFSATPATNVATIDAALDAIVPGGVTVADAGGNTVQVTFNTPGNQAPISGFGGVHEQQTYVLGSLAAETEGLYRLVFNGEATRALKVTATSAEVDAAIDALATIRALRSDNGGSVNVQAIAGGFQVDFNDLGNVGALSGIAAVAVQPALDVSEETAGVSLPLVVAEKNAGLTVVVPTSQPVTGDGVTREVQRIDLANVIGVSNGAFQVEFGGDRTNFLPRFATAADLAAELNALGTVGGAGGVTVAKGPGNTFDVTFTAFGPQVDFTAVGGVREVQTLDGGLVQLVGNSQFTLTFNGDTIPVPLSELDTAADVEAALNGLASVITAGGVTVTTSPAGFEVRFDTVGNQAPITGTVDLFETQTIDLQTLSAVTDGKIQLSFAGESTGPLDAGSNSLQIEQALNGLNSIQALAGGFGSVTVVEVAPGLGVFRVEFNQPGNVPLLAGTGNSFGTTERLPGSATPAQIDAALDSVSFVDITVAAGALPGTVVATFEEKANQPLIAGATFIHEQQRVDIYALGTFTMNFSGDITATLPFNATAEQIRAALEVLPAVIAKGGVRQVIIGENSSFSVIFNNDNDVVPLIATQTLNPLTVTPDPDGTLTGRETQVINFTPKGAFRKTAFEEGNLVGAIYDYNEIDSSTFHFINLVGSAAFEEGDMPIDGIVMARNFDQATVNFTPEAKLTATGFFDSDNRI